MGSGQPGVFQAEWSLNLKRFRRCSGDPFELQYRPGQISVSVIKHNKIRIQTQTRSNFQMPRCCAQVPNEFTACYASVLLLGSSEPAVLEKAVASMEAKVTPCVSTWCPKCCRCSVILPSLPSTGAVSAYYSHLLAVRNRMKK